MLPKKTSHLRDCHSHASDSEIFIVEGKSALQAIDQVRSRKTQAVLSMQGKIPNANKLASARIHANVQCQSLFDTLGCTTGPDCNPSKLRYGQVWLVSDGDTDGLHSQSLLLSLFVRYLYPLLDAGVVGVIHAPRYRIEAPNDDSVTYLWTEEEKRDRSAKHSSEDAVTITSFKGLASLTSDELIHWVLNKKTRRQNQITTDSI